MIARPQRSPSRLFPLLTVALYAHSPEPLPEGDESAAASLLPLAHRELTRAQQLLGRQLAPQDALARLLNHHRLGLEAEVAAQWQRADFYWRQVQNQLKALSKQPEFWSAIAQDLTQRFPTLTLLSDPVQLRQRFVEEVLVDTHCGFYNGLLQADAGGKTAPSSKDKGEARAFTHIRHIEQLLPYTSLLSDAEVQAFLSSAWQEQINRCRQSKQWAAGMHWCRHRLRYQPDSIPYQNELAEMQANAILATLHKPEAEKLAVVAQIVQCKDAVQLQRGIRQFETLAKQYSHNLTICDYLGNLHYLHAIRLGNTGQVAEGLVAIEKALIYVPYLKEAATVRQQLQQGMGQLQAQAAQLQSYLAQNRNTRLHPDGQKIVAEARKGFGLSDRYLKSPQAKATRQAVKTAQAMNLWHSIRGLPKPHDEQQAIALFQGVSQLLSQPPAQPAALPGAWQAIAQTYPDLKYLNAEPIQQFLTERLWKQTGRSPIIPPLPTVAPTVLQPKQYQAQPDQEPFLPWLFSRQHLGLKVQAAAAIVALVAAGGWGLYELSVRNTRQASYAQILAADPQQNPADVMAAAETFLSHRPLANQDAREGKVRELYAQAFVAWFLQQPQGTEPTALQAQFERYQTLMQLNE